MRVEVMEHYGLTRPIDQAGYYETAHHKQLLKDIKGAIHEGRLVAVCGVVGSGKTVTLGRLQQQLTDENKIIVARSLGGKTYYTACHADQRPVLRSGTGQTGTDPQTGGTTRA